MANPKLSAAQRFHARAPASQASSGYGAVGDVVEQVAEAGVAEVDELGGDALTVHVGQPQDRRRGARATPVRCASACFGMVGQPVLGTRGAHMAVG